MFPGLKADQCGLTAVSNEGKTGFQQQRGLANTHRTILRSPGAFEFCVERGCRSEEESEPYTALRVSGSQAEC